MAATLCLSGCGSEPDTAAADAPESSSPTALPRLIAADLTPMWTDLCDLVPLEPVEDWRLGAWSMPGVSQETMDSPVSEDLSSFGAVMCSAPTRAGFDLEVTFVDLGQDDVLWPPIERENQEQQPLEGLADDA